VAIPGRSSSQPTAPSQRGNSNPTAATPSTTDRWHPAPGAQRPPNLSSTRRRRCVMLSNGFGCTTHGTQPCRALQGLSGSGMDRALARSGSARYRVTVVQGANEGARWQNPSTPARSKTPPTSRASSGTACTPTSRPCGSPDARRAACNAPWKPRPAATSGHSRQHACRRNPLESPVFPRCHTRERPQQHR